jgi:hypothetical protein
MDYIPPHMPAQIPLSAIIADRYYPDGHFWFAKANSITKSFVCGIRVAPPAPVPRSIQAGDQRGSRL